MGIAILDFALAGDFGIVNTFYKKREDHLVTFESGYNRRQIDYFLVRRQDLGRCKNYKVILGECLMIQHRLLVLEFCFKSRGWVAHKQVRPRTKWWTLKGDRIGS